MVFADEMAAFVCPLLCTGTFRALLHIEYQMIVPYVMQQDKILGLGKSCCS